MRPIRYGLSGRRARYWAYADLPMPAHFYWRHPRRVAFTARYRGYLLRWVERVTEMWV